MPFELLEGGGVAAKPLSDEPAATVCSCNGVTVGEVQTAIRRGGLRTVAQVGVVTRAATGCGGCTADVQQLLSASEAAA